MDRRLIFADALASLYISIAISLNIVSKIIDLWIVIPIFVASFWLIFYAFVKENIGQKLIIWRRNTELNVARKIGIICFLIIMLGQLFYYMAYYPGGFNLDAYGQWDQIHGNSNWDDWHPVLTTSIYWLLTRVSDTLSFAVFFQLVLFSISVSVMIYKLAVIGVSEVLLIGMSLWIAINPAIGMNNVCLVKDVYFTIFCIWLYTKMIEVYISGGKKFETNLTCVVIAIFLVLLTFVRHNGIIMVAFFFVSALSVYKSYLRRIVGILILYILICCLIYGPVYQFVNISRHSNVLAEVTGIPMALMTNAYIKNQVEPKDELSVFMEQIADKEVFEELYVIGEWDSCRWDLGGTQILKNEDPKKIINLTISTLIKYPQAAYESVRENTRIVWQLIGVADWEPWVYIEEDNIYGFKENKVGYISDIEQRINSVSHYPLFCTFIWNMGTLIVCLLILCVHVCAEGTYPKLLFVIPMIGYSIGTMFLLSGPNQRYFYYFSVLFLPVVFMLLIDKGRENGQVDV